MKLILTLMLAALPAAAAEDNTSLQELAVPVQLDSSAFDSNVESVSEKIRRLIWESRRDKNFREVNNSARNPEAAQTALDTLTKEYPELKKEEPHAFEYQQGRIWLFKKDYDGAYKEFDSALKALETKYSNGLPPQGPYYENNASFMADLYMGRGVTKICKGMVDEAIKDINRGILISPKPRAYMQSERCRALVLLKRYQEASAAYDVAFGIDHDWPSKSGYHAKICEALGKKGFQPKACQINN